MRRLMVISSRTPEGTPHRCQVCGRISTVEPSYPPGDSCCSSCGSLLWWFRDRLSRNTGVNPDLITPRTSFGKDLGADSLDIVELVMELESEYKITIPDHEAERIKTVAEAIVYIEQHRGE